MASTALISCTSITESAVPCLGRGAYCGAVGDAAGPAAARRRPPAAAQRGRAAFRALLASRRNEPSWDGCLGASARRRLWCASRWRDLARSWCRSRWYWGCMAIASLWRWPQRALREARGKGRFALTGAPRKQGSGHGAHHLLRFLGASRRTPTSSPAARVSSAQAVPIMRLRPSWDVAPWRVCGSSSPR